MHNMHKSTLLALYVLYASLVVSKGTTVLSLVVCIIVILRILSYNIMYVCMYELVLKDVFYYA